MKTIITIQNSDKDIICVETTLPKALVSAGIKRIKYSYIKQRLAEAKYYPIKYKKYIITKHKI